MATLADGGINATNDARAATANNNNKYTVASGDTLWGISKKYGTSVTDLQRLNPGLNPNALKVGSQINYSGTAPTVQATSAPTGPVSSFANLPTSYSTLSTPTQLMDYAKNQANNKFENEKLGYQQNIDRYNQQVNQLYTDDFIKNRADELAKLKYADSLLEVDASRRNAQADKENQLSSLNLQYNRGLGELHNTAFNQRASAKNNIYSRGLGDSTVLDQAIGQIDSSETSSIGRLTEDMNNNIATLDRQIGALMANLDAQQTSLTQRQATEMVQTIQDMTKTRDDEKARLNQLIDQQNQNINQSRNNMTTYADSLYQDQYSKYADLYRQDREFEEAKRQFDLEYALKKSQASSSGGGGYRSGWVNYGNGGGGTTYAPTVAAPTTKETTTTTKQQVYSNNDTGSGGSSGKKASNSTSKATWYYNPAPVKAVAKTVKNAWNALPNWMSPWK